LGQAELIGREALRLLPNDHTIMFSLANVLGKLQKYQVSHWSINIINMIIDVLFLPVVVKMRIIMCFFIFVIRSQRASSSLLSGSAHILLLAMAI